MKKKKDASAIDFFSLIHFYSTNQCCCCCCVEVFLRRSFNDLIKLLFGPSTSGVCFNRVLPDRQLLVGYYLRLDWCFFAIHFWVGRGRGQREGGVQKK